MASAAESLTPSHPVGRKDASSLKFITVDVFTKKRYSGNPLAVVLVPATVGSQLSSAVKQRIAREFNLSETIFLHEPDSQQARTSEPSKLCRVDIFTTETELPFAGHPSIGAAHLILNHFGWQIDNLQLKAGAFPISLISGSHGEAEQSDPVCIKVVHDMHIHSRTLGDVSNIQAERLETQSQREAYAAMVASLHADETIREAELQAPVVSIVKGMTALLVELPSLKHLAQVSTASRLDFGEDVQDLLLDSGPWVRSFCYRYYYVSSQEGNRGDETLASASSDQEVPTRHIRTRMVELASEDPATGSAAATLGAYLAMKEHSGRNKVKFEITQGVEMGRKSDIKVAVSSKVTEGRASIEEITLGGNAVVVMEGAIHI